MHLNTYLGVGAAPPAPVLVPAASSAVGTGCDVITLDVSLSCSARLHYWNPRDPRKRQRPLLTRSCWYVTGVAIGAAVD